MRHDTDMYLDREMGVDTEVDVDEDANVDGDAAMDLEKLNSGIPMPKKSLLQHSYFFRWSITLVQYRVQPGTASQVLVR